jgi:tetratricopeptide (TPR) repeat protein
VDDDVRRLATRAGELLSHAGLRAGERGDEPAAVALLTRAASLLPRAYPRRLGSLIALGYALHESGELERAANTFSEATAEAAAAGQTAFEARAELGRMYVQALMGSGFGTPTDRAQAELAKLEELGDEVGLAEGYFVLGAFQSWLGSSIGGGQAYERAMDHARRAGLRRLATYPIGLRAMLQGWGAMNAVDGLRECDELLEEYAGTFLEPSLRTARAMHLSFLGRAEESQREHELSDSLNEQFGRELMRSASGMSLAEQEMRAGRLDAAEAAARDGIERLERLGEQGFLSSTLGQLAEVLVRQGRFDEAEQVAQRTAEVGTDDDFEPMFRWRAVQARVHAHRGEHDQAERLARESVDIVSRTDWCLQHAQAACVLAEVLDAGGRSEEARAAYEQALELFEQKGSIVDADRIRRRLG